MIIYISYIYIETLRKLILIYFNGLIWNNSVMLLYYSNVSTKSQYINLLNRLVIEGLFKFFLGVSWGCKQSFPKQLMHSFFPPTQTKIRQMNKLNKPNESMWKRREFSFVLFLIPSTLSTKRRKKIIHTLIILCFKILSCWAHLKTHKSLSIFSLFAYILFLQLSSAVSFYVKTMRRV